MKFSALIVLATTATASAQPVMPAGYSARLIAPQIDGQVPQLESIDDPAYGEGVLTASGSSHTITLRLLEPSGQWRPLAVYTDSWPDLSVMRLRLDSGGGFGGLLHATIRNDSGLDNGTILISVDPSGGVAERYRSPGFASNESFDFEFASIENKSVIVMLDRDKDNGTRLAVVDTNYAYSQTSGNSVPAGRSDTDVQGLKFDATGLYGGSLVLADTDDNDQVSAIYELRDAQSGGSYHLIAGPVNWNTRRYGDLDIAASGPLGGVIYITEQIADEIQQVAPDGTHTTWATGFVGIDSLSISPDGESMYVADLNGVWLIRPEGNEPGPALVAHDPSTPPGSPIAGNPVTSARLIFSEPVSFTDADVTITDKNAAPVAFDASGSGSQFMIIGFATPLEADTYTITVADTLTSVATGQPLDGNNDGIAGGDAVITLKHQCPADFNNNDIINTQDFIDFLNAYNAGCP